MCHSRIKQKVLKAGLLLILTVAVTLGLRSVQNYHHYFGMYHDDGIYLVTAKALAEGHGYKIISLPGEPYETKYPIGFSLILSAVWKILPLFPENLFFLEVVQLVFAFGSMVLAALYLVRTKKVTPLVGLTILGATMLNSHFLDFAPMLMSEMPYTLLAILALWKAEVVLRSRRVLNAGLCLGALLALVILTRAVGVSLLAAIAVCFIGRRRARLAVIALVIPFATLLGQLWWQRVYGNHSDPFLSFYTDYLSHAYRTLPSSWNIIGAVSSNVYWDMVLGVETSLPFLALVSHSALPLPANQLVYTAIYLVVSIPGFVGGWTALRRGSLPGLYAFLYWVALALWPVHLEWRHVFPVLPLCYYLYFSGARVLANRLKRRLSAVRNRYRMACAAVSIVFGLYLVVGQAALALDRVRPYDSALECLAPWLSPEALSSDYAESWKWIRKHAEMSDVFLSNNDPLVYLNTGRKAVMPTRLEIWRFMCADLVDWKSTLEAVRFSGARYIVVEPVYRAHGYPAVQTEHAVEYISALYPGSLSAVFTSLHHLIAIYRVDPHHLP